MSGDDAIGVDVLRAVDPRAGVALYRQIADQLADVIRGAAPGTRLPSEPEIVTRLGVSRATATQALRDLEQRGLVYRRQGKGTYVAKPGPVLRSDRSTTLPSFSEDLRAAGRVTYEQVTSLEIVAAEPDVAAALGLRPRQDVWRAERVIISDDEPVVHVTSWLPCGVFKQLNRADLEKTSLYAQLQRRDGSPGRPCFAKERWSAAAAPGSTASILELPRSAPVMRVVRTAFLHDTTPAEHSVAYVRSDTFAVAMEIDAHEHLASGLPHLADAAP